MVHIEFIHKDFRVLFNKYNNLFNDFIIMFNKLNKLNLKNKNEFDYYYSNFNNNTYEDILINVFNKKYTTKKLVFFENNYIVIKYKTLKSL